MCIFILDLKLEALKNINFDDVITDIKKVLVTSKDFWPADYGNYGPLMIRLAWHSSGSYRIYDGRGGSDGGRQRFDPERSWPDNTNLDKARSLLVPIKQKYGLGLSWGDLIVLAGNTAIESMGGPVLGFCGGRIDEEDGSESIQLGPSSEQYSFAPCHEDGKCQAPLGATTMGLIYVNPEGPMGNPIPKESANDVRDTFARMAMDDIETVALIGGGHAFGKTHGPCPNGAGKAPNEDPANPWPGNCGSGKGADTFTSGFEFPWTTKPTQWDNEYFQNLVNYEWHPHVGPGGHYQWSVNSTSSSDISSIPEAPTACGSKKQQIGMLTSDISLLNDPMGSYQKIVSHWAKDKKAFEDAFSNAWYKLSTRDMGPVTRCVGNNVPPAQPWQYPLPAPSSNQASFDDVKADLEEFLELNKLDAGKFTRLAWQCSSTFRVTDYLGGCNGARIRFSPQKDWSVNKGVDSTLALLEPIKEKYGNGLSWADLIILAGNTAIEKSSNLKIEFCAGRTDAADGDGSSYLKPFINGDQEDTNTLLRESINLSGLTLREYTALYGAGYIIGDMQDCAGLYCRRDSHMNVHRAPKQLSNEFFKTIVSEENWEEYKIDEKNLFKAKGKDLFMLKVDLEFKYDPELEAVAQEFAANNDLFLEQFKLSWEKLSIIDRFDGPYGNVCTIKKSELKVKSTPHKSEL